MRKRWGGPLEEVGGTDRILVNRSNMLAFRKEKVDTHKTSLTIFYLQWKIHAFLLNILLREKFKHKLPF
jgi:hypothetical protein